MSNIDNKTILGRFGFQDNDLSSPEHDKIVGLFLDNKILFKISNIVFSKEYEGSLFFETTRIEECCEEYILYNNSKILGFIDYRFVVLSKHPVIRIPINIEVKTSIKSIGELLRQMGIYKHYFKDEYFVVVAPNTNEHQKERLYRRNIILIDLKELY